MSSRLPPVPLKRTLVLVSDFISSTTRFLNHFSALCEERLLKVSRDVERVETGLVLLESRLLRVPGMEEGALPPPTAVALVIPTGAIYKVGGGGDTNGVGGSGASSAAPPPPPPVVSSSSSSSAPPPPPPGGIVVENAAELPPPVVEEIIPPARIDSHPDYIPLFKMLRMGIPMGSVQQKAAMLGLRGDVLEDPSAPITILEGGVRTATTTAKAPPPPPAPSPAAVTASLPPEYERFVRMLKVGVPLGAVREKVALEGLDPLLIG
jgi:hypothetical protein